MIRGTVPPRPLNSGEASSLHSAFPSDLFGKLLDCVRSVPGLASMVNGFIQVRIILDASIVQEEIRWLFRRRDPAARSSLQEAIDSGVVLAIVPDFLDAEIEEHIGEIARDTGRKVIEVRAHWHNLRSRLHVYRTTELNESCGAIAPTISRTRQRTTSSERTPSILVTGTFRNWTLH
jgi:hypothetical protein